MTTHREFLSPRLKGSRFEGDPEFPSLPIDVLLELVAYRELVVQTAKALYRSRHGKERVPKKFVDRFQLRLMGIGAGSAVPALARIYEEGPPQEPDEFDDARDLISESVEACATGKSLPAELPKNVIPLFGNFGKKLRADEWIELRPGGGKAKAYTPEVRKRLVLMTASTYSREIDVSGTLVGVSDAPKTSMKVLIPDLGIADVEYPASQRAEIAGAWRDPQVLRVQISGVAIFDKDEAFQKFESVSNVTLVSELEEDDVRNIEDQIREFYQLEAGWLDGEGHPLPRDGIDWLRSLVLGLMAAQRMPIPHLYPTAVGGIVAEWTFPEWEVSADFDLETRVATLHAANLESAEAEEGSVEFLDDEEAGMGELSGFLSRYAGGEAGHG